MRERSSALGELDAKACARPPSALPPAAASIHLSPPTTLVACAPLAHSLGSPRCPLPFASASASLVVAQNSVKCSLELSVYCSSFDLSSHISPHKVRKEVLRHLRVQFSRGQVRKVQSVSCGSLSRGSWVRGRGFESLPHG